VNKRRLEFAEVIEREKLPEAGIEKDKPQLPKAEIENRKLPKAGSENCRRQKYKRRGMMITIAILRIVRHSAVNPIYMVDDCRSWLQSEQRSDIFTYSFHCKTFAIHTHLPLLRNHLTPEHCRMGRSHW
jgi:hypothetical protein